MTAESITTCETVAAHVPGVGGVLLSQTPLGGLPYEQVVAAARVRLRRFATGAVFYW